MRATIVFLAAIVAASCSLALDFDDQSGLPCECAADHVCLRDINECVPRSSVDLFKSCRTDTANGGDDLCPEGAICVALNGRGSRCLPTCTVTNFSTPEAAATIAAECSAGTLCWTTDRQGVCDEGECSDLPNTCTEQQCKLFNGAGRCFTRCEIFKNNPCGGAAACHPIGASALTACIAAGARTLGELCSDTAPCTQSDVSSRSLVCGSPLGSDAPARCWAVCAVGDGSRCGTGETCLQFRSELDSISSRFLGICSGE